MDSMEKNKICHLEAQNIQDWCLVLNIIIAENINNK